MKRSLNVLRARLDKAAAELGVAGLFPSLQSARDLGYGPDAKVKVSDDETYTVVELERVALTLLEEHHCTAAELRKLARAWRQVHAWSCV